MEVELRGARMMEERRYPQNAKYEEKRNPAIHIFGNRLHNDQSLYEYLIEFLLVFSSAKKKDGSGRLQFHDGEALHYYFEPRNGFRRFVFYEQARKTRRIPADEEAYNDIRSILLRHVDADKDVEKQEFIQAVQDLFRGYAAVLKKRSWCAQTLLPLCPEMIFCEEMPNDATRIKGPKANFQVDYGYNRENTYYDSVDSFDLTRHNFLARGGEMYYLHLMQALDDRVEQKIKLQKLLRLMLTDKSEDFSSLANWIQNTWEKEKQLDPQKLIKETDMGYIPLGAYKQSGQYAVEELICFLSNQLHPVKRIELLAKGIMFQIMRMQADRVEEYLGISRLPWIIDMRGKSNTVVKQLSVSSFNRVTEAFITTINQYIVSIRDKDADIDLTEEYKDFVSARKESLDVFRSKGKEIQCIIPSNGPFERFSLSEDIVKFLVLSLIAPGEKYDLDSFLRKLYEHYALVIGPAEYKKCLQGENLEIELTNVFDSNKEAFQKFLKDAGFLRSLSDATSIVLNPYEEVEVK